MTDRGVVYAEPDAAPAVEELTVDPPGPHEVRVRVLAYGLCHTDLHVVETKGWGMRFPILLGHEGAGVVEELGSERDVGRARRPRRHRVARAVRRVPAVPARRSPTLLVAAPRASAACTAPPTARCSRRCSAAGRSPTRSSSTRRAR